MCLRRGSALRYSTATGTRCACVPASIATRRGRASHGDRYNGNGCAIASGAEETARGRRLEKNKTSEPAFRVSRFSLVFSERALKWLEYAVTDDKLLLAFAWRQREFASCVAEQLTSSLRTQVPQEFRIRSPRVVH